MTRPKVGGIYRETGDSVRLYLAKRNAGFLMQGRFRGEECLLANQGDLLFELFYPIITFLLPFTAYLSGKYELP